MPYSSIDIQYGLFFLSDGEPLKLPESLESLPKSDHFPNQRHRWNTNEVSVDIHFQFWRTIKWYFSG